MELLSEALHWLVAFIEQMGIIGVFVMTFLESTFVPLPSEATMIPVGYLVHEGKMDYFAVLLASVGGTVAGAYFSYWLAVRLGRGLLLRYQRFLFITEEKLDTLEAFFTRHGSISIFTGRLIPGVRHFISFPAGLARMPLRPFFLYTTIGGAIWMNVLIAVGYFIGKNKEAAMHYMPMIKLATLACVIVLVVGYRLHHRRKAKQ